MIPASSEELRFSLLGTPEEWQIVNDGVMGGISRGRISSVPGGLKFSGALSLTNGGGFASAAREVGRDMSAVRGFRMRVRGDGRCYQLRVTTDNRPYPIAWRRVFQANGEPLEFNAMLDEFEPVFRGRILRNAGGLHPASISRIGLMVADRREGRFELAVESIEAMTGRP